MQYLYCVSPTMEWRSEIHWLSNRILAPTWPHWAKFEHCFAPSATPHTYTHIFAVFSNPGGYLSRFSVWFFSSLVCCHRFWMSCLCLRRRGGKVHKEGTVQWWFDIIPKFCFTSSMVHRGNISPWSKWKLSIWKSLKIRTQSCDKTAPISIHENCGNLLTF